MIHCTLPYDIWESIIKAIINIPRPQHPPEGRLRLLTTCALLSKDFSALCRPGIFEHISGIEASFEYFEGNRFLKLVDSITSNPGLVGYIRTLSVSLPGVVNFGDDNTNGFPQKEIDRIFSIFADIPHLEMISIQPPRDRITTPQAEDFQSIVVKAHLLRTTLHTLDIYYLPIGITIMDIIGSTSLRSLSLGDCPKFSRSSFMIQRPRKISHLHVVTKHPNTPFILLDYLPNLTDLEITEGWSNWTNRHDNLLDIIPTPPSGSEFDPSKLKRVQVESVPLFFQFCVDRRVREDLPLFASLEEFHLWDGREEGVEVVRDMLKETRSLRSLTIAVSPEDSSEEFPFEIYDLSARFTDGTLSKLTDLHLIVQEAPYSHYYSAAIDGLIYLFLSMAHLNVLERIKLSVTISDVLPKGSAFDAQQPNQDLRPVADTLACVCGYPALREVQIEMSVWQKRAPSNRGDDDMVSTQIDGLQKLRCRPRVVVQDALIIRYTPLYGVAGLH